MAVKTSLIPIQEMTPGRVAVIRNDVIQRVVSIVASELGKSEADLVVRDIRPASDLAYYAGGTTTSTVDEWLYDATTTTASAFTNVTPASQMGDQRWVAIFGVRDLRLGVGVHTTAMNLFTSTTLMGDATSASVPIKPGQVVSFIQFSVGGSNKVIWDITSINAYDPPVGFSEAPVLIPQNTAYQIQYYFVSTIAGMRANLQLAGVVVEPRGRTVSP